MKHCLSSRLSPSKLLFAALLFLSSCSTVNLKHRAGKDRPLTKTDFSALEGTFTNAAPDSVRSFYDRKLEDHFVDDSLFCTSVRIRPEEKRLHLDLYDGDSLVTTYSVKGRFKKGYFRTRRRAMTNFFAGPVLWVVAEDFKYVGVTKDNNLIVLNSGGSGLLMFFVVPLFAAGGGDFWDEYPRQDDQQSGIGN